MGNFCKSCVETQNITITSDKLIKTISSINESKLVKRKIKFYKYENLKTKVKLY